MIISALIFLFLAIENELQNELQIYSKHPEKDGTAI